MIAIAIVLASLLGIVLMKNKTDQLKEEFKEAICPSETSKADAWADMQLPQELRTGLIGCFCKPLLFKEKTKIFDFSFDEFNTTDGKPDSTKYCGDWALNYGIQQGMIYGSTFAVVFINIVACMIFEKIVAFEKRHT